MLALAAETIDFSTLVTALTGAVSASTVLGIIGTIVTTGMSFALLYWGARKIVRGFMSAVKSGRISI